MKFFVSTGEVSGDLHLSYLVNAIRKIDPSIEFCGAVGEHSRNAGVTMVQDIRELAVMGFFEIIRKISFFKKKIKEYLDYIEKNNIDRVILVDYGGFNLKLLTELKAKMPHIKVYYYIPPKIWVWGRKRIKKIVLADEILVIFPWEVEFYKGYGIDVVYYGNPFADIYQRVAHLGDKILLLPGSRRQEIMSIMPVFHDIITRLPEEKFVIKLSSPEHTKWFDVQEFAMDNVELVTSGDLTDYIGQCKIGLCTSGTVTLEVTLLGLPAIILYKTNKFNEIIVKYLLKVKMISLPNITLGKIAFPEMLQKECNADDIIAQMDAMLGDNQRKLEITNALDHVRQLLQPASTNVVEQYARHIIQ